MDHKSNHKAKGNVYQEYDNEINYYGDETFLKIASFEQEKNQLESRISLLEGMNKVLEWRNKAVIISGRSGLVIEGQSEF